MAFVEFFGDAEIHYYEDSGGAGYGCGRFVLYAFLHPDGARADLNCGFDDFGNQFRATENIHDVDFFGNVFQAGVGFFAEDGGFVRVDGNDAVAGGLEILRHAKAGAKWFGREAYYRDCFGRG